MKRLGARLLALSGIVGTTAVLSLFAAPASAAAPPNDNLANAASVQAAAAGTLDGSTFEPGEEAATGVQDFHTANWGTVWYAYTPANNVSASIRVAGKTGLQPRMNVFTGTNYSNLILVAGGNTCSNGDFQNGGCETLRRDCRHDLPDPGQQLQPQWLWQRVRPDDHRIGGWVHLRDGARRNERAPRGRLRQELHRRQTFHAQTTTASNGSYTVAAPSGSDRVEFSDCNETTQAFTEWHNDKTSFATADAINVPAGGNASIGVTKVQRGVRISGTVSADGGGPLSDVCVTIFDATTGMEAGFAITAGDGAYNKLLPAGSYKVQYRHCASPRVYAGEWYDDAFSQSTATPIDLEPGEVSRPMRDSRSAERSRGPSPTSIPTMRTPASRRIPRAETERHASAGTSTDASDTSYVLSGLAAGSYRIKLFRCDGPTPGPAVWNPLHHSFAFGQSVAVTSGGTTDLPLGFGDPTAVGAHVQASGRRSDSPASVVDVYDAEDSTLLLGSATTNAERRRECPGPDRWWLQKLKFTDCGGFGFGGSGLVPDEIGVRRGRRRHGGLAGLSRRLSNGHPDAGFGACGRDASRSPNARFHESAIRGERERARGNRHR